MPFLTSKPCDVTDADMTFKLRDTVITMPPCWYYIIYHEIVINASFLGLSATFLCAAPFPSAHRMMNHVIFRLMYSPLKKPARQKMEIQLKGAAAQSMLITAINPVHQTRIIDWFCTNVLCTPDCNKKIIKIQPFLLIPCDFSMQRTSTSSRQLLGDFEVRGGECVRRWREGISLEWLVLDVYWSIVQLLCTLDFLLFDVSVPPPPTSTSCLILLALRSRPFLHTSPLLQRKRCTPNKERSCCTKATAFVGAVQHDVIQTDFSLLLSCICSSGPNVLCVKLHHHVGSNSTDMSAR